MCRLQNNVLLDVSPAFVCARARECFLRERESVCVGAIVSDCVCVHMCVRCGRLRVGRQIKVLLDNSHVCVCG